MNNLTLPLLLIAFLGGYYVSDLEFAKYRVEQDKVVKMLQEENAQKLLERERQFAEAISERDAALDSVRESNASMSVQLERMRSAASANKMSRASDSACKSYKQRLASCEQLLIEGAELLREGAELSERQAVTKDAIVKIVGYK